MTPAEFKQWCRALRLEPATCDLIAGMRAAEILWYLSPLALATAFVSTIILLTVVISEREGRSAKNNSRRHKKQ